MPFDTALTRMLGIDIPVISAPMAGVAGGKLAAAVTGGGGLGLIGGGYPDPAVIEHEFGEAGNAVVGLASSLGRWLKNPAALDVALAHSPKAVFLSFADIAPFVAQAQSSGATLIAQVQTVGQARAAADAGADMIVAQGTEAGGHGAARATLPLVPAVVDAVGSIPVLAGGGIADGRGLAAALALGAAGAVVGSAFVAAEESLASANGKQRLATGSGDDTAKGSEFDLLRGIDWPDGYQIRTMYTPFFKGIRDAPPTTDAEVQAAKAAFDAAREKDDMSVATVIAGEAADMINAIEPASVILQRLANEAEAIIRSRPGLAN